MILSTIIVLMVLIVFIVKFLPNVLNNKYKNLTIYKNNNIIIITEEEKNEIIKYLKKEILEKQDVLNLTTNAEYIIKYDDIEISFDEDNYCYYKNNYTEENYYSSISKELKQYIIDIVK